MNFREQKGRSTWENKLGNKVTDLGLFLHIDRYIFDFDYCASKKGWKQYDTDQDASYFGIWVHLEDRLILTYCEGDLTLVDCPDNEHLKSELDSMAETYGDPPPAFKVIDGDGTLTHYFDERPAV